MIYNVVDILSFLLRLLSLIFDAFSAVCLCFSFLIFFINFYHFATFDKSILNGRVNVYLWTIESIFLFGLTFLST